MPELSPTTPIPEAGNPPSGWRYAAGLVLLVLGDVLLSLPLILLSGVVVGWIGRLPGGMQHRVAPIWNLWIMLGAVALMSPVLAMVVRQLHGWRLRDLLSPGRRPRWDVAGRSAVVWGALVLASIGADALLGRIRGEPWPFPPFHALLAEVGGLLPFLLATLPLLGMQVAAEELVFRGYLDRALRRWLGGGRLMAPLGVALAFTALHTQSWGQSVWDQRLLYFLLSLLLSWITRRSGGLEAAIGVHFAQNFAAIYINGSLGSDYPSLLGVGAPEEKPADWADIIEVLVTMTVLCGCYALSSRWIVRQK